MKKIILPVLFIGVSIGIFFGFIDPHYQQVKELRSEVAEYDEVLQKSKKLLELRDKLLSKYNTFSDEELNNIEHIVPNNVDNVKLILEINNIAAKNGLLVKNISISSRKEEGGESEGVQQSGPNVSESSKNYNSIDLSFSVDASYSSFKDFMKDLEQSLRLIDIRKISFSASEKQSRNYEVGIRTYWLKK